MSWTKPHHGVSHLMDTPVFLQATIEEFEEWTHGYVLSRHSPTPFTPIDERLFDGADHAAAAKRWLEQRAREIGGAL